MKIVKQLFPEYFNNIMKNKIVKSKVFNNVTIIFIH